MKVVIRGIFSGKEGENYHFILPEVYHGTEASGESHTCKILKEFGKKNSTAVDHEVPNNINCIVNYAPIYRDGKITNNNFSNFKAKSKSNLQLIVGLEYKIDAYLNEYSFTNENKQITGWYIRIISIKEDTKI